jgi:hypothetical protein
MQRTLPFVAPRQGEPPSSAGIKENVLANFADKNGDMISLVESMLLS